MLCDCEAALCGGEAGERWRRQRWFISNQGPRSSRALTTPLEPGCLLPSAPWGAPTHSHSKSSSRSRDLGPTSPFSFPLGDPITKLGQVAPAPQNAPAHRELLFPHLPGSPVLELAGRTSTPGWWWAPPAPAEPPAHCLLPAGTCRHSPCWDLGRRGQRLKQPPCAQSPPAWDQLADVPVPVTGIAVYGPVPPCAAWFMYTLCMGEPSTEPAGLKVPGKLVGPEGW